MNKDKNLEKQKKSADNEIEEQSTLKKELEENTNILKRLQAEFENHIKRTDKEKQELCKFASASLIKAFLPVVDDFKNMLKHIDEKEHEGIVMLFRNFMKVLEDEGLKKISSKGIADPFKHEVILQKESDEKEGTIIEEIQTGYMLNDKVLRHSKVIVAGPKTDCLKCKYHCKVGINCSDACMNKKYIEKNKSTLPETKKELDFIAFSDPTNLPRSCSFFEANHDGGI